MDAIGLGEASQHEQAELVEVRRLAERTPLWCVELRDNGCCAPDPQSRHDSIRSTVDGAGIDQTVDDDRLGQSNNGYSRVASGISHVPASHEHSAWGPLISSFECAHHSRPRHSIEWRCSPGLADTLDATEGPALAGSAHELRRSSTMITVFLIDMNSQGALEVGQSVSQSVSAGHSTPAGRSSSKDSRAKPGCGEVQVARWTPSHPAQEAADLAPRGTDAVGDQCEHLIGSPDRTRRCHRFSFLVADQPDNVRTLGRSQTLTCPPLPIRAPRVPNNARSIVSDAMGGSPDTVVSSRKDDNTTVTIDCSAVRDGRTGGVGSLLPSSPDGPVGQ